MKTDNELIADFMGRRYGQNADKNGYLKYDTSWDHLMPVVEKINYADDNNAIHIDEDVVYLHMTNKMKDFRHEKLPGENIKAVYKAVVYCIKKCIAR